jgi:hypothetical protein
LCSWIAVAARLRGGCRYSNGRPVLAANPLHVLRRRVLARFANAAAPRA